MNVSTVVLAACLIAGIALRQSGRMPKRAPHWAATSILYVCLPATVIASLHRLEFRAEYLFAIAMPWIQFVLAWVVFAPIGRSRGWRPETIACLTLVAGLGNTSFLGFPILEFLVGREALPYGVLIDQMGTFLVLSTLGVAYAAAKSGTSDSRFDLRRTALKLAKFPPFVALVAGLALRSVEFSDGFAWLLHALALPLGALALFWVGMKLDFSPRSLWEAREKMAFGLGFKLLFSPAVFLSAAILLYPDRPLFARVTVLEAAMAPMISSGILAEETGLEPELAARLIAIGALLSLATTPIWNSIL